MKILLLLLTLISINSWAADFKWDGEGYCVKKGWDGRPKRIFDSYCGRDTKSWGEDGYCYKYAGSGRLKAAISDIECGKSFYKWDIDGDCIKYAGSEREIGKVGHLACYVFGVKLNQ